MDEGQQMLQQYLNSGQYVRIIYIVCDEHSRAFRKVNKVRQIECPSTASSAAILRSLMKWTLIEELIMNSQPSNFVSFSLKCE